MKSRAFGCTGTLSKWTLAAVLVGTALASGCEPETGREEQASSVSRQALRAQSKPGVAVGEGYSMALRPDGTVWAWGQNGTGALGDGTITNRYTPGRVSGLPEAGTSVESIWAGYYFSLALLSDGTVRTWGSNSSGQLGDGTLVNRSVPVKVLKNPATGEALSGVVALAAGYDHVLALDNSGKVWAWGENALGELGDGTTIDSRTPQLVLKNPATGEALSGVVAIAAGKYHSLAVLSDGSVWSWGYNGRGQLGNNSKVNSSLPVQVPGVSGAVKVGAGEYYSLAVLSDGSVRAWGDNSRGQLGDGTMTDRLTPVAVSNLSGVTFVEGSTNGGYFSVALKADGSVWAWGNNNSGQLGDGLGDCSTYPRPAWSLSPVQVLIDQVDSVSTSVAVALARRTDGTIWFWGSNSSGGAGTGQWLGCATTPQQVQFPSP